MEMALDTERREKKKRNLFWEQQRVSALSYLTRCQSPCSPSPPGPGLISAPSAAQTRSFPMSKQLKSGEFIPSGAELFVLFGSWIRNLKIVCSVAVGPKKQWSTVFRICNVHLHNSFSWYIINTDPPTWVQNKCWDYFHKLQTCWNFSYSAWSLVKFWHKNHRDHVLALVSLPQTQLEHVHSLYSIFFSPQKWLQ